MKQALAPMLFEDHDRAAAEALRESVVAPAKRSMSAMRKIRTGKTSEGLPVHSFRSLIADLGTLTKNRIHIRNTVRCLISTLPPLHCKTRLSNCWAFHPDCSHETV
jgi:hypothetical protein